MLVRLKIELKSVTPLKVSFIFASPHDPETLQRIPSNVEAVTQKSAHQLL